LNTRNCSQHLGYAVLWASMPAPKEAAEALLAKHFADGVLPAIDAAIARGIIDPDRASNTRRDTFTKQRPASS
jgi:hypothetical protein